MDVAYKISTVVSEITYNLAEKIQLNLMQNQVDLCVLFTDFLIVVILHCFLVINSL